MIILKSNLKKFKFIIRYIKKTQKLQLLNLPDFDMNFTHGKIDTFTLEKPFTTSQAWKTKIYMQVFET